MTDPTNMPIDQLDRELQSKSRSVYAYEVKYTYNAPNDFYLKMAILRGDLPRVEVYLRCGASPNPKKMKRNYNGRWTEWFPLEWAVTSGKLEMVELLLQFGADVNTTGLGTRRFTALRVAVEKQHVAIVQKLLGAGACPESYQHHYGTVKARESRDATIFCDIPVLFDAVKWNNVEIAEMLLRKGAKANLPRSYKLNYSYLTEAVRMESLAMVALLLQFGADPNFQVPKLGTTPLMLAAKAKKNAVDMTKLLAQHGADVNVCELIHKRQDALTIAVANEDPELVRLLLQLGARANTVESAPLCAVAMIKTSPQTCVEIAGMLIDRGANVNGCDLRGVEPLFAAVENENVDVAEVLLMRGVKADIVHGDMTPLKQAVVSANEKLIRVLLRHGASPRARVFAPAVIGPGREICSSALQLAMEHGSSSTIIAMLSDPQVGEPEPAPTLTGDDEEKRPIPASLPPPLSTAISRESAMGRLPPIGSVKESATTSSAEAARAEVKRNCTRATLSISWALCHQAGRSMYCEWELVAPELDLPMLTATTTTTTSYQSIRREPMEGVIIARGKTTTAPPSKSKDSSAEGGSLLADWHNDGFKLSTCTTLYYNPKAKAKAMNDNNQRSLQSCELRFRVKTEGGFLSTSKTVGEAWFQLSQLETDAPLGTKAVFLVELRYKNKRTGTMAFELTD